MATVVTFLATASGTITSQNATYATMLAGSSLGVNDATNALFAGQTLSGVYIGWESFVVFDTSSLPSTFNLASAVFSVRGSTDESTQDFNLELWSSSWPPTLTSADWNSPSGFVGTRLASVSSASYSTSYFALADVGVGLGSYISQSSALGFLLTSDRFVSSTTPTTDEDLQLNSHQVAGFEPKLTVAWDPVYTNAAEKQRVTTSPMRW